MGNYFKLILFIKYSQIGLVSLNDLFQTSQTCIYKNDYIQMCSESIVEYIRILFHLFIQTLRSKEPRRSFFN